MRSNGSIEATISPPPALSRYCRLGDRSKQLLVAVFCALLISVAVTLVALFIFGYIKGRFTTPRPFRSALETALVGSLAAGAAFLIAKAIS